MYRAPNRYEVLARCAGEMFDECEPALVVIDKGIASRLKALGLLDLVRSAIDNKVGAPDWDVRVSSSPIRITKRFDRPIGWSERVETLDERGVFYARVERFGAPVWGRFVRRAYGVETNDLTVLLRPVDAVDEDLGDVAWGVVGAYAGDVAPPFPHDPFGGSEFGKSYWSRHALLDGAVPYKAWSVTTQRPW